ncbi:hypothetical protein JOC34_001369 [Virgibacillus halotolerans]|uniref:hypothetical protein n=1 Tax=Virgibacillus halotolerans TaxID=1071053 RepID=UPI0019620402|nr:hypothetical protein [Virgibacillus halotolerans]MBM7599001.1 hypothetical protein [Virgibacillus halotolerans]
MLKCPTLVSVYGNIKVHSNATTNNIAEIKESFGTLKKFDEIGGMYFDKKGIAHIDVKEQTTERPRVGE